MRRASASCSGVRSMTNSSGGFRGNRSNPHQSNRFPTNFSAAHPLAPAAGPANHGDMDREDGDERLDYAEADPNTAERTVTELAGLAAVLLASCTVALAALLFTGIFSRF